VKKLELPIKKGHGLRGARFDELVQKTTDIGAVQYLAGNKDIRTSQIYLHPDFERAQALLDADSDKSSEKPASQPSSTRSPKIEKFK